MSSFDTNRRGSPDDSRGGLHPDLRLHSVHVFVRNQERSLRFYLDKLGFQLVFDARLQSGERWLGVSPPNGTAVLTLIEPKPDSAESKLIGRATRVVFVTEDVPAKFRDWSKLGVRFRHPPRLRRVKYEMERTDMISDRRSPNHAEVSVWGEVFTRFEDIDRNSFALVSFDAVTAAIEAQRRVQAEKLEADRRIAYEFDIARQVQSRLFPQHSPPCSGLDYAGTCLPARHVAGDYYDYLSLGDERLGIAVGDVAGKGIAAALLMSNLQAHLRSQYAIRPRELDVLLQCVNQHLFENTSASAYATLLFAEYDSNSRRLRYVNCGHVSGILLHGDSVQPLPSTSTVLGLFRDCDCSIANCQLSEQDILVFYTDGVTESFNPAGDEFGEDRLLESVKRHAALCPGDMVKAVLSEVQRFSTNEQHDDMTLIIAKCGNR
jgi:serine phosphatase RsbU (regulator of sigma subunit)/catechol 2,3-dioxygenase-like lactoylglutathione lyase family enzyme